MPVVMAFKVILRLTVALVMMMMRVLQVVLVWVRVWAATGLCFGAGRLCSWLGAWWAVLLAGPVGGSDAEGAPQVMRVAGDADGEGVAADAPGDVVGEGGVGGAPGVGVACGGDGVGAAGGALVDGVSCVALVVRVLLVMVLGVGPCHPWRRAWWVEMVCWFTRPGGADCLWCRRVPLVMLMVGMVQVMVLLMSLAWVL